jgi:hypothetical protein
MVGARGVARVFGFGIKLYPTTTTYAKKAAKIVLYRLHFILSVAKSHAKYVRSNEGFISTMRALH